MFKRTLVVFENQSICQEAVVYARELAKRMDSEVTLLVLVEMAFLDRAYLDSKRNALSQVEETMGRALAELTTGFLQEGIAVTAAMRVGEPAQELIKFLAERPPYQALIWGSDLEAPEGAQGRRGHWFKKVAHSLECPLLTVSSKDKTGRAAAQAAPPRARNQGV